MPEVDFKEGDTAYLNRQYMNVKVGTEVTVKGKYYDTVKVSFNKVREDKTRLNCWLILPPFYLSKNKPNNRSKDMELKVGMNAVYINDTPGTSQWYPNGTHVVIKNTHADGTALVEALDGKKKGVVLWVKTKHLKSVSKKGEKDMKQGNITKKNTSDSYTFKVASTEMIDWRLVLSELSYSHPMAMLQVVGSEEVYFAIHSSVEAKLNCITKKRGRAFWNFFDKHYGRYFSNGLVCRGILRDAGVLQKMIREIKDAPFMEETKNGGIIEVRRLTI